MNRNELAPAVFAVNQEYHIMLYPSAPCLMWVKVGDKIYYDESNGILRSCTDVHRVIVPMQELDAAKSYVVCLRYIVDRKPYFPEIEPVQEFEYNFRPVTDTECVRAYHIADAHNWSEGPIMAAQTFGNIDFLILNGDIPEHNGSVDKCRTIYELTSEITKGEIPTVFARGNHDFRIKETNFIKDVISRTNEEYLAEGITHRIVICHCPFTFRQSPPFDVEEDIYREWTKLLREHVHPDVIINGHMHYQELIYPGDAHDHRNQSCPVVIGSAKREREYFAGAGFVFDKDGIEVHFTDNHSKTVLNQRIV